MVVSAACLAQVATDFISGTSSHGSTDPQQHLSTKKRFSSVDWGEGRAVIDRYLFRFHGENSLRLGLSDSSGVQRIEEEQSDVPQGCHFGYLG